MKLNNTQLELLYPVVIRESQQHPHPQWDALLETLTQLCADRGMQQLLRSQIPATPTIPTNTCEHNHQTIDETGAYRKCQDCGQYLPTHAQPGRG